VSKARKFINSGELELAQQETAVAISSLDKAVSKGVFHRNKSARLKSRLIKRLNAAIAVEPEPSIVKKEGSVELA